MADITMCSAENCPMKNKCYRTTARVNDRQSWSNFEYTCNEDNEFEDFISNKNIIDFKRRLERR